MDQISKECAWADFRLQRQITDLTSLPEELRSRILQSITSTTATATQYLNSLAVHARTPECTEKFFALYKPLYPDFAARWVEDCCTTGEDSVVTLSALSGVLPLAPWLRPFVDDVLDRSPLRDLLQLPSAKPGNERSNDISMTDDDDHVLLLLLATFRLLSFERDTFDRRFHPIFFTSLLSHESRAIRTVAVECLCLVMHFADGYCEKLLETYVGKQKPVLGKWEGAVIDYRLLKLWEERRWTRMIDAGQQLETLQTHGRVIDEFRQLSEQDLHTRTALIGGVLLPRDAAIRLEQSHLVLTPNSESNLQTLGKALLRQKPILLAGPAGAGKTSLIMEAARLLNKQESLITLHLNEQTDAKSLIGLYTSSTKDGSFVWQAGVLTRALQQGRWVLIEDIDRAPAEVLGVLRPLIETGSLFIPNRRQHVKAAEGFRIIGSVRTASENPNSIPSKHGWLTSNRLWSMVVAHGYPVDEIAQLFCKRYPAVQAIRNTIFATYEKLILLYSTDPSFKAVQGRPPSVRDLLKWCRRITRRVQDLGVSLDGSSPVPETLEIDMFKDAINCLASHLSDPYLYSKVCQSIAQVMNIAPQQRDFYLNPGEDIVTETPRIATIGRSTMAKLPVRRSAGRRKPFANTGASRRGLESVAAAVSFFEPCLLVGETGVGKTSLVQHIATVVNQTLTVVNLSQQSEVSDLLGGLKPVTTRSLVLPVLDQFNSVFDDTFSSSRNEKFQAAVNRAVAKESWSRLLKVWQEALQMADKALKKATKVEDETNIDGPITKRRKLETPKYDSLRLRWSDFENNVNKLRSQVERGDKNQTFAFVEGRLVQAVRNGEWLLLDEINLASSDTLDHVVSLLGDVDGQRPSILLAEAGNIEKVVAHPNFRVFAAMNPATDAGKKDLPPGLRGRFTELYVHSGDDNADDLVRIIQSYLGEILSTDKKAALDLARTYLEVQQLNLQHRLTDGAGDAPHFSIRSLVRCLLYVIQHSRSHGLRRSMYEGFAMSFFTSLSRDSEALCSPVIEKHLLSSVKNVKSFLAQQPKLAHAEGAFVAFRHHLISKGSMDTDLQPHYIRTPSVERNLMNLARAASMRRFPILLQGPTSAGKTSMVEYLAKLSGNKFIRINNHEHTDLQEYLGSYGSDADGKLRFREGVLVNALREGHWIVLDELNLAPSDVLEALNRLLDDNRELLIPETQEIIRPHPNFMLFATQNPAGLYGGRKRFSRAFRNRFLEIHFDDIPENELEIILRERAQIAPSFCTQIVAVYKKLSLLRQSSRLFEQRNSFATLRDLFRWASRPVDDRQELARHGFMLLAERVREISEREIVKMTIEETMKIKLDESTLYGAVALPATVSKMTNIVWTQAMRRLYVLVSEALKNNEPVLLVGETGCGKTQICQVVAAAFGRPLNIYNAHTNTETGDLIGSQRPVRSRAQLAQEVIESIEPLITTTANGTALHEVDLEALISRFADLDTSKFAPELVSKVQLAIGAYRSLFVWSDGSLVRSMKLGEHFLLDEISLADDSVLERLNSVLEPGRTIVLAEKGSVDNIVIAQTDFQFVSTMNPGGDYGKRELSAALRNRMTEIWVPPLSNDDDVLPIVQATLREAVKHLAPAMLKFAAWFKSTFHHSAGSSIPLRDLLTWAKFLNVQVQLSGETAFVHGAGLVFIDSVGANPAGMTALTISDISTARQQCLGYLQTLVSIEVDGLYNACPKLSATTDHIGVGLFTLARVPGAPSVTPDLVFDAPTTLKNTMRIVRALQLDRPVLLEGNPGVGKTAIVTALAQAVGKSFTRINLSDQTDLMDLFGADAPSENESLGRFAWQDGPLLQAMQTGGWVLLDEMNLASQSVLEGLNSCLDHRKEAYIAELDKTFSCHPDFRLFAAQNPHHQGGGRKGLPASFVNRFTVVYADPFEEEDLMRICEAKYPEVNEQQLATIVRVVSEADHLLQHQPSFLQGGPWEVNLRDVSRWLALCQKQPAVNPMYHFDVVIATRFRDVKQKSLLATLRERNVGNTPAASSYSRLTSRSLQIGNAVLQRSSVQQPVSALHNILPRLLPVVKSVVTAIQHGWPIILSGSADCGKTEIIRSLAAVSGHKLLHISMNADIDTMDLLGGFEQYDSARDVEALRNELSVILFEKIALSLVSEAPAEHVAEFLAAWQACQQPNTDAPSLLTALASVRHYPEIAPAISRLHVLNHPEAHTGNQFVWNDGVLIDAILSGSWVVLDNANLCNASVLDRLNSLLEANGNLVISEQHSHDGAGTRTITPHHNFRIFLTVDPKYGELSRAMRNRSLEISLPEPISSNEDLKAVTYNFSASVERLRELASAQYRSEELAAAFADNLAIEDIALVRSDGSNETVSLFSDLQPEVRAWLTRIEQADTTAYHSMLEKQHRGDVFLETAWQPVFRLLKEPDFKVAVQEDGMGTLRQSFDIFQLRKLISKVQLQLDTALHHSQSLPLQELSTLQRSAMMISNKKISAATTPAMYSFVHAVLEQLYKVVESTDLSGVVQAATVKAVGYFLTDLISLSAGRIIDFARFQSFLQIGQDMYAELPSRSVLTEAFGHGLQLFNVIQLNYGQGLQAMWQTWSPKVPQNREQLAVKLNLEALLESLDQAILAAPQKRTDFGPVKQRLLDAAVTVWQSSEGVAMMEQLTHSVAALEHQVSDVTPIPIYFQEVFVELFNKLQMRNGLLSSAEIDSLVPFVDSSHLLHGLPSAQDPATRSLAVLSSLVGHFDVGGENLVKAMSFRLSGLHNQPLRVLQTVREESGHIVKILAGRPSLMSMSDLDTISEHTAGLLKAVVKSQINRLSQRQASEIDIDGDIDLGRLHTMELEDSSDMSTSPGWLQSVLQRFLQPAASALLHTNESLTRASRIGLLGRALMAVTTAALTVFVPDKPFDPALLPQIIAERHDARGFELDRQIVAQQQFNQYVAGQENSLVEQLLQHNRNDLGIAPVPILVARPQSSSLGRVQEEFNVIIKSILQADLIVNVYAEGWPESTPVEISRLRDTVTRVIERLRSLDRAYDDIVVPVRQLLSSLGLGIEIAQHSNDLVNTMSRGVSHVPLLGGQPCDVDHWSLQGLKKTDHDRLRWLQYYANKSALMNRQQDQRAHGALADYLTVVDSFYAQWKERLRNDQLDAENKSRYYAYRGGDDEDPEAERREMGEMFPVYDHAEHDDQDTEDKQSSGHASTALKLLQIHQRVFGNTISHPELGQNLLTASSAAGIAMNRSSLPLKAALPALFLQLEDQITSLYARDQSKPFNIYTDHHIEEIERLQKLVQDTRARFAQIHEQWPEHAVPIEVRVVCDDLLDFALDTPLAKLLTKTEKLLEVVAQWQSVASREWSAAALLEDITALIVRWRRLELSSWSRLLDIEKQKHDERAASWFFIAYEAVLYNSRVIADTDGDVRAYCFELVKTLEEFFRTATLGQFEPRLRLLRGLGNTLSAMSLEDTRLLPIAASVANILAHYDRYAITIQKTLSTGRADLEKAVVEQIRLASWKDTNVTALKDSARRSHHKLFKIVRKYRALLNQPISNFKSGELRESDVQDNVVLPEPEARQIDNSLALCIQHVPDWQARPARLREPLSATVGMRRVYNARQDAFNATTELESIRLDLAKSIQELRKETPSALTKDNAALVKHLRERKRRLLADTIKDVAHMGIRRNLATTDLLKQATTSAVLGSASEMKPDFLSSSLLDADEALHELIDCMPQVRNASTEHSPDLTDGEVRRGVGLLEGLLQHSLSQREQLVQSFKELRGFSNSISDITSLRTSTIVMHLSGFDDHHGPEMDVRLRWLPAILDLSVQVLQIQAKHGNLGLEHIKIGLRMAAKEFEELKTRYAELPRLPSGLKSEEMVDLQEQTRNRFAELERNLHQWQDAEANVEFLVHQMLPWVQLRDESPPIKAKVNGINHLALNSIDQALRDVVDSVFVALQLLSAVNILPVDATEDVGWLTRSDKNFNECTRALHVSTVHEKLSAVLINLQHLRPENLPVALSLLIVASPVIEQFYLVVQHALNKQANVHNQTVRLACFLAKSFTTISNEGFCTPSDPNDGQEQSGKLESGTGLGDGEGAEDISKDVADDEDLTEFAQGEQEDKDGEVEDAEDAVDMGADDLEGQMGDAGEREAGSGDDDSGSDAEGEDMDEETGSVDDLDPNAVDEKMWDEAQKDGEKDEKELKGDKQKGDKTEDQTEANGEKAEGENEGEVDDAEGGDEEMEEEDEHGEGKAEAENADPHLQDEQALELPEELQLNGEEDGDSDNGDPDGMDDLSDVDLPADGEGKEEVDSVGEPDREEHNAEGDRDGEPEENDEEADGVGEDDQIVPEQEAEKEDEEHMEKDGEMQLDEDEQGGGDKGAANEVQEDIGPDQNIEGQNQVEETPDEKQAQGASSADNKDQGESGKGTVERGQGRDNNLDRQQKEALRKLADVLEQWHQRREILNPAEEKQDSKPDQDVNMNDADFEHLDDEDDADAQALGAAGPEQPQNVDMNKAIQDEDVPIDEDTAMPDPQERPTEEAQATDRLNRLQANVDASTERREDSAFVPEQPRQTNDTDGHDIDTESLISETASDVQHLDLNTAPPSPPISHETATQLWHHCSQLTHQFSLVLTEQLRLILHPTTATKLRGDFRSGKRLNLKRIIPYIASGYKRDKIWMRRSVPSKRNYQIMLAVDDSKSMAESGADLLALQTTALLCKSLAMLEVGEVCVVGFGDGKKGQEGVKVAHDFGDVWKGADSGVDVFGKLGFRQEGTDVKLLVRRGLEMMEQARLKKTGGSDGELWQLMIIVSDGHCSEHEEVRRLVRRGKEERVLIVFVILDNISSNSGVNSDEGMSGIGGGPEGIQAATKQQPNHQRPPPAGDSILDLKEAVFEEGPDGEMKVVTRRYLERFPFEYYLVVRDVRELPGVLGRCLKGWFGEVSGS